MMLAARSGAGEIPPGDAAEAAVAAHRTGVGHDDATVIERALLGPGSRSGRFAPSLDPRLGGCAPGSQEHERGRQSCSTAANSRSQWSRVPSSGRNAGTGMLPGAHRTAPHRPERREARLRHSASHRSDRRQLRPSRRGRAGMTHAFLSAVAEGLATRGIAATCVTNSPEHGEGIETCPDRPALACAAGRFTTASSTAVSYSSPFLLSDGRPSDVRAPPPARKQRPSG